MRDLGAPKEQKAYVLQITPCSFQVWKPPQGLPHSRAASGQPIYCPCFHGNKNWMGEKRGEKSSCNRWRFPVWKVGFSQAGLLIFQDFFPRKQKEGHALMWRWMGGSGLPLLPAAFRPAAPALRFNAVIYGHSAATEVLTWLKASVF